MVIDLSGVSFLDSAGLAVLARARRDRVLSGRSLVLVRPASDDAMRVFRLTRFDEIFTMVDRGGVVTPGRALVVDDDVVSRLVLSRMLRRSDWVVDETEDVPEALAALAEHRFDLVVADYRLPSGTGSRSSRPSPGRPTRPVRARDGDPRVLLAASGDGQGRQGAPHQAGQLRGAPEDAGVRRPRGARLIRLAPA